VFIATCDESLNAQGRLLALLPAVNHERDQQRQERAATRKAKSSALRSEAATHSEVGDEDVEPTDRRGLLGAGAAAALGVAGVAATPTAAREVDPELPAYWADLLVLLSGYDDAFGPSAVRDTVRRELKRIAEHRQHARGELRAALLHVEAQWAELAAFLSADMDDSQDRDGWTKRALWLALEAGDADAIACVRMRQGQWATDDGDGRRAVAQHEQTVRVAGTCEQTRARCALRGAMAHALTGDAVTCQRWLEDAYSLAENADEPDPAWVPTATPLEVRATEARCWLALDPHKAIPLYDSALRDWPTMRLRARGVHQARLALAYAATGESDRAKIEGRRALAINQSTKSATARRELRRLGKLLRAS
jgi:tetratricopeptide (TPR) repeat protein